MFISLSTAINYTSYVDLINFLVSIETTLTPIYPISQAFVVRNSQPFPEKQLKFTFFYWIFIEIVLYILLKQIKVISKGSPCKLALSK